MPENDWILLNVPKYASKNCSNYARVLNVPQYSYSSINIIVTVIN